jgi:glycine dehydrogenase subunit 1
MASEVDEMLAALGLASLEDLFAHIPPEVRVDGLPLPPGRSEKETVEHVAGLLAANRHGGDMPTFLGAGVYDHYVPAAVRSIVGRSEFCTSYTPYQAELSQGILQTLFEYQSMICELTGMDGANTSMYDASTALGEAALMARRITRKTEILVPRALLWERRSVLANYAKGAGLRVRDVGYDEDRGILDLDDLRGKLSSETAAVYLEQPNFFGVFEDAVDDIRAATDALLVVGVNPLALAVTKPPGDYGADIVVGEGQALGNAMNFGGPLLGIFACREDYIRKMPGRVIGATRDAQGGRAFAMTLQTREQHIRREKAMSNICTNETLLAVASAVYVAILGARGLKDLAEANVRDAANLAQRLDGLPPCEAPLFRGHHFNEFVVRFDRPYDDVHRHLLRAGVHGGLGLAARFPELGHAALFATTERHDEGARARLIRALEGMA